MLELAVVRLRDGCVEVLTCASPLLAEELRGLGLQEYDRSRWEGAANLLEPTCSLLDRLGVHWGVYDPSSPRTFGERLFAECPPQLAPRLYDAVHTVLSEEPSTALHRAVLEDAWRALGTGEP